MFFFKGKQVSHFSENIFFRLCGENLKGTLVETSKTNKIKVSFHSDYSYVDRGFLAEYEAIDIKDRKWQSYVYI